MTQVKVCSAATRPNLYPICRLPKDETSQGLLNLFDSLRQSLVGALEIGARRNTASSDMQLAQAQLSRQGVAGVTSDRLLSGSVQLVGLPHCATAACC